MAASVGQESELLGPRRWRVRPPRDASLVLVYLLIPVLVLAIGLIAPSFIGHRGMIVVLLTASILGIASVGQTLTLLLGGIDLSIPAVIAMANVLTTTMYGQGSSIWLVLMIVLGSAVLIGIANGVLIRVLAAPPLIVTLAMGTIVIGGVLTVSQGNLGGDVPDALRDAVSPIGTVGPIPLPGVVVVWIVVTLAVIGAQRWTVWGQQVYLVGMNPRAAAVAHVRLGVVWAATYAVSAFFAAVAGVFLAGVSGGANVQVGDPYLFLTIAAVVVGGTSLLGGRGGYGRTVAGAIVMSLLGILLAALGQSSAIQQILLGCLIVGLVAVHGREQHIRDQL